MLTFFVELSADPLWELMQRPGLVESLRACGASVSMAMLDLSSQRRAAVQLLNQNDIPVTAWLVLEQDQGYWMTVDNALDTSRRYQQIRDWARQERLLLRGVGLDIEIPMEDSLALLRDRHRALFRLLLRRRSRGEVLRAAAQYSALVQQIRGDGFLAETYQYSLVLDDRLARSTLLQRSLGILDVGADREVLMLYSSVLPEPWNRGLVDAYGPDAEAIGVGITGGGAAFLPRTSPGPLLGLDRLLQDLRRARRYTDQLYVFSLEGCVAAGYLDALCAADLDRPVRPSRLTPLARTARAGLRPLLRAEGLWDLLQRRS